MIRHRDQPPLPPSLILPLLQDLQKIIEAMCFRPTQSVQESPGEESHDADSDGGGKAMGDWGLIGPLLRHQGGQERLLGSHWEDDDRDGREWGF